MKRNCTKDEVLKFDSEELHCKNILSFVWQMFEAVEYIHDSKI